jgi:hypothetical protein
LPGGVYCFQHTPSVSKNFLGFLVVPGGGGGGEEDEDEEGGGGGGGIRGCWRQCFVLVRLAVLFRLCSWSNRIVGGSSLGRLVIGGL